MRRTLVALSTAIALTLGVTVPVAQAAPQSSEINQQFNTYTKDVPADLKLGSSGVQLLFSNPTPAQQLEAASLLGRDWLIGMAAFAVLGGIIQAAATALR